MESKKKILIVDDEPEHCAIVSRALMAEGYITRTAYNGPQAIEAGREARFDIYLLDIRMQPWDGIRILEEIRKLYSDAQVIMLTAFSEVDTAVKCMKLGACDFLNKPINLDELLITVANALKSRELQQEVQTLRTQIEIHRSPEQLLGESPKMIELMRIIEHIASHNITVLIRGESGTGKELTARALHAKSPRAKAPFVSVDCATLPESLVESELFGYERGAFTGAAARKIGRFEHAADGTLFLDEIGNLSVPVQVKLLRALQERKFHRLGGKEEQSFKAAIITATNINLEEAIRAGCFREDLYYRLNEFMLRLPSLRERREDIPLLAKHFLNVFNRQFNKSVKYICPEVMSWFEQYAWPGNVRELKNVIKRAVVLASERVELGHLPENQLAELKMPNSLPSQPEPARLPISGTSLKEIVKREISNVESRVIQDTLETAHWNRTVTAKKLEIDYKTLYNKMKEYGIG
ncbi:sigma-54-dependent Fis family transcriptional regulator [bacterium]|nr:sigma-54-dependent Fis family transcriptional regulator [bacterium]